MRLSRSIVCLPRRARGLRVATTVLSGLLCALLPWVGSAVRADDEAGLLEQRVKAFWDARVAADYAEEYRFLSPADRSKANEAKFVEQKEKRPYRWVNAKVSEVAISGDLAWAHVQYEYRMIDIPDTPPTRNAFWHVWQRLDQWHPIPKGTRAAFPSRPPHLRPAAAEAELAKRVGAFWRAQAAGDWETVYRYLEPGYRARVSLDAFIANRPPVAYSSAHIEWAEVLGARGRAKVAVGIRPQDPSLAKLGTKQLVKIDAWVKTDGQWYRRVKDKTDPQRAAENAARKWVSP